MLIYSVVFVLLVALFVLGNLFLSRGVTAKAWWGDTHTEIVKAALNCLCARGDKEAAEYFLCGTDELLDGAVAPDRLGDIDHSATGGIHYYIPVRFKEGEVPYFKRAGLALKSPFMKTACTIAEENYTMALLYGVLYKKSGKECHYKFALNCLGRALHGLCDSGAMPHATGKRLRGRKSFHYRFESISNDVRCGFAEGISSGVSCRDEFLDKLKPSGDYVRRILNYLSLCAAADYNEYEREEEALTKDAINRSLLRATAAAACLLRGFYRELVMYSSVSEVLTGKKSKSSMLSVSRVKRGGKNGKIRKKFEAEFKLRNDFPCFEGGFRVARSGENSYYMTSLESGFSRVLTIKRGTPRMTAFNPKRKNNFLVFSTVEI